MTAVDYKLDVIPHKTHLKLSIKPELHFAHVSKRLRVLVIMEEKLPRLELKLHKLHKCALMPLSGEYVPHVYTKVKNFEGVCSIIPFAHSLCSSRLEEGE